MNTFHFIFSKVSIIDHNLIVELSGGLSQALGDIIVHIGHSISI